MGEGQNTKVTKNRRQVRSWSAPAGDKRVMSIRHLPGLALTALGSRPRVLGWALSLAGLVTGAWAQAPSPTHNPPPNALRTQASQTLSIDQVLQAAGQNLDVAAVRRNYEAAQADILAADHAPLPVLSAKAGSMDLNRGLGAGSVWQQKRIDKGIGLDWTWERGDKRTLRTQTSRQNAQAAQADWQDAITAQRVLALQAFYDWLAAQLRQEEMQGIAASTQTLAQAAQRRLQAGDVSAQDATRTDIEAARALADVRLAELDRQRAALALAPLIAWPGQPLQWRPNTQWPTVTGQTEAVQQAQSRLEDLVEQRPDVQAARERVQAAQSALQLARAQQRSDITWGGTVDHFPSETGTTARQMELRLQMPLQWGYRYEGEIGRATALQGQSQDMLERIRLGARAELQSLLQAWDAARDRLQTYEDDILPRALRVAQQAELAYTQGALTLTDLLDARRTLRTTRLEAIAAQAEFAKAQGTWQLRTTPATP
jgi:cobalt-zinc-cadmium efflux system outer membrane protein